MLIDEHRQFIKALGCNPDEKDSKKLTTCLNSLDANELAGEQALMFDECNLWSGRE